MPGRNCAYVGYEMGRTAADPDQNNQFYYKNAVLYFEWLREQFEQDQPMDKIVRNYSVPVGEPLAIPPAISIRWNETR